MPPKLEFVSEPPAEENPHSDFDFELDNLNHDIDVEPAVFEPKLEPELSIIESESPPPDRKRSLRKRVTAKKAPKTRPVVKQYKSSYKRKRTFQCYLCSLDCSKLYELKAHITIFHPFEEQKREVLNCPYCPKTTISRILLSRHLRKVRFSRHLLILKVSLMGTSFCRSIVPYKCTNVHAASCNLISVAHSRSIWHSIIEIIGQ